MPGTGPLRRSSELARKKAIVGKSKRQREIRNLTTLVLGFAFTNRAEKIVEGIAVTSAT